MTQQPPEGSQAVTVWEKSQEIRIAAQLPAEFWPDERIKAIAKTVAPQGTTLPDLALFLSVCHKYDLDPFVGEIWLAWDEKKKKFVVLTGRDAFLKTAMRDPNYEGVNSGAVYSEDTFIQKKKGNGEVEIQHEIHSMVNRGQLVGAYAVAYRKGRIPVTKVRTFDHYKKLHNRPAWQTNPDDMIETRVITAALRQQYNISGLYTEAEMAGIDEGDGALQDFAAAENMMAQTSKRVEELRAQVAGLRADQEPPVQEVEVLEEEAGPPDGEELFPEQEHGPLEVGVDAYVVDEDEAQETPVEEEEVSQDPEDVLEREEADKALQKAHKAYMVAWKQDVGADDDFRHRWQKAAIGKESTSTWTLQEYEDATEIVKNGDWVQFVAAKGADSIQPELG